MIETSSVPPQKSSATFGNLRKMFGKCLETFIKPSEQFWKIFRSLRDAREQAQQNRTTILQFSYRQLQRLSVFINVTLSKYFVL